jgi:hypothetical protein
MQMIIMAQDRPPHYKGDIVEIRASGTPFGGQEPEAFVMVEVPDIPMDDFEGYNKAWERLVDFEVVSHDAATDTYQLRLYSTTANSGQGEITKDDVEAYIQSWNGTVDSWGTNEVYWTVSIYDALTSPAFWEIDVSKIAFTEQSYDSATGVHRIDADYSALGNNPTYVERYVKRMGLTIVNHNNRVLTYDAGSSTCASILREQLQQKTRQQVRRRRYHISGSTVDTIIDNGGTMSVSRSTAENYITDKAAE